MKIELSDREQEIADNIFEELVGLTIEQAKIILKAVLNDLDKNAVIRGDIDE